MKLDVLVIAAHPDDAEICVGGSILRWCDAGRAVGIVDLTRGELGTRGSAADRAAETAAANLQMRLALRTNLEQPDGRVTPTVEARERLARVMRETAPEVVIAQRRRWPSAS